MNCSLSQHTIDEVISFHRHSCPGLAIGIRASEYALQEFPETNPTDFLCITETDMCGVDAIQYLTGCSFGKGNLIYKNYGKIAFSFYDRNQERGVRLLFSFNYPKELTNNLRQIPTIEKRQKLSKEESQKNKILRKEMHNIIMSSPLETLFTTCQMEEKIPQRARIQQSLPCEKCYEKTMESRTRRYNGKTLCIPCFTKEM